VEEKVDGKEEDTHREEKEDMHREEKEHMGKEEDTHREEEKVVPAKQMHRFKVKGQ